MKSLRLTKQMRESILASFVAKYKEANVPPIEPKSEKELGYDLAAKLHDKVYGKYLGKVPEDLFYKSSTIKVQMPNDSVQHLYFPYVDDNNKRVSTRESKVEYVLTKDDPFFVEYDSAMQTRKEKVNEFQEYNKALSKFRSDVSQVLESVNTTKQLIEVWPESEPFLPTEVSNPSSINLPAVNFAEINKVIK